MASRYVLVGGFLLGSVTAVGGQAIQEPFLPPPGTEAAQFYQENAGIIRELLQQVSSGPTNSRLQALDALAIAYPDAALSVSTTLINDEDKEVAREAARLLADSIVMEGHPTAQDPAMPPGGNLAMRRSETVKAALRTALKDPDDELRRIAAGVLSSLGDTAALDIIRENAQEGRVSEVEAINYFGLARPEIGAPYIAPYLAEPSIDAQRAAVSYLGALPDYQDEIRTNILLNSAAGEASRVTAAEVLSKYDQRFSDYALAVAANPELPPSVYTTIVGAYAREAFEDRTLTREQIQALSAAVQAYTSRVGAEARPQLERLDAQIEALQFRQ